MISINAYFLHIIIFYILLQSSYQLTKVLILRHDSNNLL